ncbi:MAG: phosphotransferase [Helicobacteraceae bacterium]|nr:phosphotransferase [Candidatus Sulfurimonas ponti]
MGVLTQISLQELKGLFPLYNFIELTPTHSGVIDTTYILSNNNQSYILKKYERDIKTKIDQDRDTLKKLKLSGLNVPECIEESQGWYLYEKLQGKVPENIRTYHIQALARFMGGLHSQQSKQQHTSSFMQNYDCNKILSYLKSHHFAYYKKLQFLHNFSMPNDGFIHGDIFKDNTVFDKEKIGVFDFIDGGEGSFSFDAAVALIGFDAKKHSPYFINLFLKTYNQHAPKKLQKKELLEQLDIASGFYALLRINKYKNTTKAKELL